MDHNALKIDLIRHILNLNDSEKLRKIWEYLAPNSAETNALELPNISHPISLPEILASNQDSTLDQETLELQQSIDELFNPSQDFSDEEW